MWKKKKFEAGGGIQPHNHPTPGRTPYALSNKKRFIGEGISYLVIKSTGDPAEVVLNKHSHVMIYIIFALAYHCKVSTIINENNFGHWLEKTKYYLLSYFQTRIILRKKIKILSLWWDSNPRSTQHRADTLSTELGGTFG